MGTLNYDILMKSSQSEKDEIDLRKSGMLWKDKLTRESITAPWQVFIMWPAKPYHIEFPKETIDYFLYSFYDNNFKIPHSLSFIIKEIEDSKSILNLPDDWDEEGAKSPSKIAYQKAVKFLILSSLSIFQQYNVILRKPAIQPGLDESVYLHWDSEESSFLIIFRGEGHRISFFYGENKAHNIPFKGGIIIEDKIDEHIIVWMKKHLIIK